MCFRPTGIDKGPIACPQCGKEVVDAATIDACPHCGARVIEKVSIPKPPKVPGRQ